MEKELIEFIVNELKSYKLYKALLEQIRIEDAGIEAQKIYETPRSVTNKFFSITENLALFKRDEMNLLRSIRQVENWLNLLDDDERHVARGLYIHNWSYNTISERWYNEFKTVYSSAFWRYKRKQALNKICKLF